MTAPHGHILKDYIEQKGWTVEGFASKLKVSRQTLYNYFEKLRFNDVLISKFEKAGVENAKTLFTRHPNGGDLLHAAEASAKYKSAARAKQADLADTRRPIYNLIGTAGEVAVFQDDPENIEGYADVPEFGNLTGYIRVFGNSMYPKYCNGDLVGCRELKNLEIIPYGEAYLIITGEHRMIKYIDSFDHDESKITLRSEHPDFKPFTIKRKDIIRLYIIKGKITRNII